MAAAAHVARRVRLCFVSCSDWIGPGAPARGSLSREGEKAELQERNNGGNEHAGAVTQPGTSSYAGEEEVVTGRCGGRRRREGGGRQAATPALLPVNGHGPLLARPFAPASVGGHGPSTTPPLAFNSDPSKDDLVVVATALQPLPERRRPEAWRPTQPGRRRRRRRRWRSMSRTCRPEEEDRDPLSAM